jgi:hypothetical protein
VAKFVACYGENHRVSRTIVGPLRTQICIPGKGVPSKLDGGGILFSSAKFSAPSFDLPNRIMHDLQAATKKLASYLADDSQIPFSE